MKAVIIDNEFNARESLKELLDIYCPQVNILGEAGGVLEGIKTVQQLEPELVFLDVQMDDGTGMDMIHQLPDHYFEVVFTTAFDQYALQAIKLSALDYLLKPIDPDELITAMEKAADRIEEKVYKRGNLQWEALKNNFFSPYNPKKIVLKDAENLYIIEIHEIIRCEATGSYTRFYLEKGRKILVSNNLREYEKKLKPHGFFRSHHSHLFNIHHLDHYEKGNGGMLIMKDGSQVPVSTRRKDQVLQMLANM